jgi:endoribonuclease Dicer
MTHMKHSRCSVQALGALAVCIGLADRMTELGKPLEKAVNKYKAQIHTRWKEAEAILKRRSHASEDGMEEALEDPSTSKVIEFWRGAYHAPVCTLHLVIEMR